jgi:Arylsulfotransferase (ASST)
MKKFHQYFIALFLVSLFFNCTQQKPTETNSTKTVEAKTPNEDRNMFGHYIQRGLTKTSEGLTPGYVMFNPSNSASIYLLNRNGDVVHEWKGNYGAHSPYLNDDGSITLMASDPDFPVFAGGGQMGRIQKISWNSKILWDFEYATEEYHAHHDIAVMPNGNVLAIAWESKSADDVLKAGRNPEQIPKAGLWPDKIVEIAKVDKTHGKVVWEWHIWNHLIQDFDSSMNNFGDVASHPELLDINKGRKLPDPISQDSMDVLHAANKARRNITIDNRGSDFYHVNAINYNPELDQIVFSSPVLDEIFIIDHSTTTEEAASHSGGRMGKGGDFLFRWGNPQNYRQGDSTNQQSFGQHDVRWIEKGKPGAGNITFYNNDIPLGRDSLDYSAVYEIKPYVSREGNYALLENNRFSPKNPDWKYIAKDTVSFYGSFISGAQRMQNGNTFINEGPKGRFFEVTPEGEIVWEYLNQFRGNIRRPNGDPKSIMPMVYTQFRSNFIPANHTALKDKELVPLDPQPKAFKLPPKPDKKEE